VKNGSLCSSFRLPILSMMRYMGTWGGNGLGAWGDSILRDWILARHGREKRWRGSATRMFRMPWF